MTEETEKTGNTVTESKTVAESPKQPEANGETKPAEQSQPEASPKAETAENNQAAVSSEPASKPSETAAAAAPQPRQPQDKERHLLAMAGETLKHIEKCEKDKSIVFRHNDRKSVMFMISAFCVEVVLMILFVTDPAFRPVCIALALLADALFGLAILWYVLLRFGVLRSFEPRQTLLTWQLMIGAGALFAFYTMNIAFAFFTYYNSVTGAPTPPAM